jgi:hypothetical protein
VWRESEGARKPAHSRARQAYIGDDVRYIAYIERGEGLRSVSHASAMRGSSLASMTYMIAWHWSKYLSHIERSDR